jgi:hypothetical protein
MRRAERCIFDSSITNLKFVFEHSNPLTDEIVLEGIRFSKEHGVTLAAFCQVLLTFDYRIFF